MATRYDLWIRKNGSWKLDQSNMRGKAALEALSGYGYFPAKSDMPTLVPRMWRPLFETSSNSPGSLEVAAIERDEDGEITTKLSRDGKDLLQRFLMLAVDLVESDVIRDQVGLGILAGHLKAISSQISACETTEHWFKEAMFGDIIDTDICAALHVNDAEFWKRTLDRHHWSEDWKEPKTEAKKELEPMEA